MKSDRQELRKKVLHLATKAKEGHVPSSLSILDILHVLYSEVLKVDPRDPNWSDRDYFILSKGHASLGLYVILAEAGFFPQEDLQSFAKFDSKLGGHPDCNKILGIEVSTGSLGHGMPVATGLALGLKARGRKNRVFCLVGDGECNEGTIWESALLAAHHKLNQLCCIIDHNHSSDRALVVDDLKAKFAAFGWKTILINGHDDQEICYALQSHDEVHPLAVIAETVKGYGFKSMENNPAWHHRIPNSDELQELLEG